jgi:hypothetical protein
MILTGTPLENHLGELWNLMRFINPGLLGSHERFTARFAVPIERDGNALTGQITRFVPYSKGRIITGYAKEHGFDLADAIAIGDSGGDTAILEVVGHPIAFNPNEELLAIATANRWPVVIERKNISYELETREDGEIVVKNTTIY